MSYVLSKMKATHTQCMSILYFRKLLRSFHLQCGLFYSVPTPCNYSHKAWVPGWEGELGIAFDVVVAVTCSQTIHLTSLVLGGVLCE